MPVKTQGVEGYRNRVLEALARRARAAWPRARPGLGPSRGAPAWLGAVGEPRSGLFGGEAPGPAVLGGPPQAKAPPRPTASCHVHGGLKCRSVALLGGQLVPTL
jgi:hypothetical protein